VQVFRQLLGNDSSGKRMQQIISHVKISRVVLGQNSDRSDAQGQIFDGVEAQIHHCMVQRGDLLGQAVIG